MYVGSMSKEEIFDDFAQFVSYGKVEIYRSFGFDFVPGRREGCYIWDVDGDKRLLNCRSSGGVFNLGHRPRATTEALRRAPAVSDGAGGDAQGCRAQSHTP